jgi:hypothetical protein
MTKITFEGETLGDIKDAIKDFFSSIEGGAENGSGEEQPKKRSRSSAAKEPEKEKPVKVTHELIRKWITENEEKKSDVRNLLDDMSIDTIGDIPDEKLEKVFAKIKEL